MKVVFVYAGAESLAVEYLSAALKKRGHNCELVFDPCLFNDKQYLDIPFLARIFDSRQKVIKRILAAAPDLLAFSVGTDIYHWACEIASEVKRKKDIPIIFGGIHVTALPQRVIGNDFIDMVCLGEGEQALVDLADSLAKGEKRYDIDNIWFKRAGQIISNPVRNLIEDLDSLPLPDKGLFQNDIAIKKGKYMTMTSRGCPFKCSYCYNDTLKDFYAGKGKYVRQRSVDNVLNELVIMKDRYNYSSVAFMDDLFVGNRPWFREFIPKYIKEIKLPYSCMTSTHVIDDEMAKLLKSSGCTRLQFGIQTMNQKTRNEILKRSFENTQHIQRAIQACDKYGISYSIDHIFGIPFEGQAEFRNTAEFFVQTKADRICCYALFYYPKTEIIQSAKRAGILNDQDIEDIEEGRGKLYVYGSSLRQDDLKLFYGLRKLYSMAPLFPKAVNRFLVRRNRYRSLRFMPRIFTLLCEAISAIKTRHPRGKDYIRYYILHLVKKLKHE